MSGLLAGTRILALEAFGAGPYGSMFLANLGAEVVKIENPATGGDPARKVGPYHLGPDDSQYFQSFNFGKKSVALDIRTAEGKAALHRLVASADAVMNNLRGDQPAKLGIDYAGLKAVNPAIVCVHISAYGRDNSRRDWPGYDYLMQAEAGLMSLTGEPDAPPTRSFAPTVDLMTGMTGALGLLAGLLRARATGQGCDIDTSLFDVALHQNSYVALWHLNEGISPQRQPRGGHPSVAPVQTCRTADGWIYVMCMMDKFWLALLDVLERPDLAIDPRFADSPARHRNQNALTAALDEAFGARSTADWLARLTGLIPVAPVLTMPEAFANPFLAEAGLVEQVAHPHRADFRAIANPIKVDGKRLPQTACSPLGGDGEALLSEAP